MTREELDTALLKLESVVSKAKESQASSSPWAWIITVIIGAIIALGAAYLQSRLNAKNAELAKLRTKIEIAEVKATQKKFEGKIQQIQGKGDVLLKEAVRLAQVVKIVKNKLVSEETRHDAQLDRIAAAKDWKAINDLK